MKTLLSSVAAVAFLALATLLMALPASAVTLTTSAGTTTSTAGAATFFDFDSIQNTSIGSFSGGVLNGGVSPCGAACGNWLSANSFSNLNAPFTLTLVKPVSYLGLFWGTTDSYNVVSLFDGPTLLGSFTGIPDVGPSQTSVFVNFTTGLGEEITSAQFSSGSQCCFETDNFAAIEASTVTPLPAALPLFATGLGGLGLLGWRRRRKAQALAA